MQHLSPPTEHTLPSRPQTTRSISTPPTEMRIRQGRDERPRALEALNAAFTSRESFGQLWPEHFYRESARSTSRSSKSPVRFSRSLTSDLDTSMSQCNQESSSTNIKPMDHDRDYSPMSAGFARLKRTDTSASSPASFEKRGSVDSTSSSSDARRMFDGPA